MIINNIKYSLKFKIVLFLLPLFFFFACSSDFEPQETIIIEEEVFERLSVEELDYMTLLLIVDEEMNDIWSNFNSMREDPIYIVTGDDQGILINPKATYLESSNLILNELEEFEELPLYRNEELHEFAIEVIENGTYFNWEEYGGSLMYIHDLRHDPNGGWYSEYKNRNGYFHVSVFYHELFHLFSVQINRDLYIDPNWIINIGGEEYPLNEETLPLILMLFDIMIDAYHAETMEQKTILLKYYVSIQNKLEELDPTENNLIRKYRSYNEKTEGAGRYIEVFSTLHSLDNNTIDDPTHGYKEWGDNIIYAWQVEVLYAWRIFYHTGAGAIHLLNELGYPNLDEAMFVPTNTPFDLAKEFLNMNDLQLDVFLEGAKISYDWDTLVERSEYLLSL